MTTNKNNSILKTDATTGKAEETRIAPELRRRISEGDQAAFTTFFQHYKNRVLQVAFYFTRSQERAEDIVQDVFLKIWNTRERLATIDYPDAWVVTIARNFSIRALENLAREERGGKGYADYFPVVQIQDSLEYQNIQQLINEALAQLTEQQRKVFILARLEGLGRQEIADRLGLSANTAKMHLVRATRYVRAHLLTRLDYLMVFLIFFVGN